MKKRTIAVLALALLVSTGCAANANSESSTSDAKTLTVAYSDGGQTLDPAEANDLTSDTFAVSAYDQLVTYGTENGKARTDKIVPMLAKSWTVSQDNLTYTFTLRDDVTFASSNEFTAQDVVYSFQHIKDSTNGSFLYEMAGITGVTAPDEHTVTVALGAPNHLFLQILPMYSFSVLDAKTVQANGSDWLAKNTAGSGPYTVTKWDPASEAVLVRNDRYWGDKPAIGTVDLKFVKEASNRTQLLSNGDVDLALEIPAKDVDSLKSASGVTIRSDASNRILYFSLNTTVKPFDNPLVRQAMAYAVPYDQLIGDVMHGQAKKMTSAVASNTPGWSGDGFAYKHDLTKAKQLLTQAGYGNGFSFDFLLGSGFDDWNDDAVLIQAELAKIGVTMNIKNMARAQFLDAIQQRNVPAFIGKWTSFVNDPGYHLGLLLTTGASSNYGNYSNSTVDADIKQAAAETDVAKRNTLYAQAQKQITADAPWLYLYEYNRVVGLHSGVSGYTYYPDEILRFAEMSK